MNKLIRHWTIINISVLLILLIVIFIMFQLGAFNTGNSQEVILPVETSTPTPSEFIVSPTPVPTTPPTNTPTPTAEPTPTPTPTPEPTPTPNISKQLYGHIGPDILPIFTGENEYPQSVRTKEFSNGDSIRYWLFKDNLLVNGQYQPKDNIYFGAPTEYTSLEGVTTFRGNNYRNSASFGQRLVSEKKLEVVWTKDIGVIDTWPGVGWTGQPMIIHWSKEVRDIMNITPEMKEKDLVEVIYPTLDGNIYFLDLETGKPTRDPIHIGFPTKGTAMVDPRGYPLLYTGQGINRNGQEYSPLEYRVFNLINQEEIFSIPGTEPDAFRVWGAFDSSGLLDKKTDTLIQCGENGLIYRIKLNTNFDIENRSIDINPEVTKYRYQGVYDPNIGIENSPVIYKNFLYAADNGGLLQCIDINTLEPVWIYNLEDDTDSTIVLEETESGVYLYTGNEADLRCINNKTKSALSTVRKFNAFSGELIWERGYECIYQAGINGGLLSTPVLGKDDISDLVIFNISKTGDYKKGKMVALNKETGEEVWVRDLEFYSWSSPVDFLSSDGKTYMIFCDFGGYMHLMDPKTGETITKISVGANVEGSPAIYDDMVVVGSYAKRYLVLK